MTRALLAALALVTVAAPAFAQQPPEVTYKQKTIIDVTEDENVFGDKVDPDGELIRIMPKAKHVSLITYRSHFIPEMVKSAERL
jgi:hypothetical protein